MEKNNKNNIPFNVSFENPLKSLFSHAHTHATRTAIVEPRGNMVRKYGYGEFSEIIAKVALAVSKTKGDYTKPIAIIAHSSFRSIAAHFGAMLGGGKVVLIPTNCTAEEKQQIIGDNQIELLIVDHLEEDAPLLEQLHFLPQLRQLWVLEDAPDSYHSQLSTLGWNDILELAEKGKKRITTEAQLEKLSDDEKLCRFYSRNEIGEFQHHDYSLNELGGEVETSLEKSNIKYSQFSKAQRFLSIIPLNRVMGHVEGIYLPLLTGRVLMAVDRQESWKIASLPYSADCVVASSHFLGEAADAVQTALTEQGGVGQFALTKSIKRLKKAARREKTYLNNKISFTDKVIGNTVRFLVKKKLKDAFGGNVKLCFAIDDQLRFQNRLFYCALGLPLQEAIEDDLLIHASCDLFEGISYDEIRGTQLSRDEDLDSIKII